MRIQAYIRVASDAGTVHAVYSELNAAGASITPVRRSSEDADQQPSWIWQTQRVNLDENDVDGGIRDLLQANQRLIPVLQKHRVKEVMVVLQVVTLYGLNDRPAGFHLSAETISLLSDLGAAFDNDSISDLGS